MQALVVADSKGESMAHRAWAVDVAPLAVRVTRFRTTSYVELQGEADLCGITSMQGIEDAILASDDPPEQVVLDLRELRFASIRSLRLIVDICDRFETAGIRVSAMGVLPNVARAAVLVGVHLPNAGEARD